MLLAHMWPGFSCQWERFVLAVLRQHQSLKHQHPSTTLGSQRPRNKQTMKTFTIISCLVSAGLGAVSQPVEMTPTSLLQRTRFFNTLLPHSRCDLAVTDREN
ncbi:hypothetical protein F9C07_11441 [Aspergillus flavus]|uniref:Uncharacterized protein n=1 Tax=Aspergillus flavus (strain ATCC 200026 / FGSC A1120 / IAM 13836 / NRRL 3357 / JCM 12722 / SRRC 167) TaxID=332952 RepID=A0A7U2QYX7_ASPFN|nr:hypothetical protein F9C07_11441 [Aspergillus flavus]